MMFLSGLIWLVPAAAAAATELPADLTSPDQRVICNRRHAICYDRMGASIGLTAAFLGQDAAERLTYQLRATPVDRFPGAVFSPAEGVVCVRETGPCRVGGQTHAALTAILFGPREPR